MMMIAFHRRPNLLLPLLCTRQVPSNAFTSHSVRVFDLDTRIGTAYPTCTGTSMRKQAELSYRTELTSSRFSRMSTSATVTGDGEGSRPNIENDRVLFIECGFGNDSHGQSSTKAAVRACRNAIEFNSIPSINRLVPGGYDSLKLDVILAIPPKYRDGLDLDAVAKVFPYGDVKFTIQDGGMVAPSGIAIDRLGDEGDDMVVVCCSVTVGY
mmetsp:Transcript_21102/g.45996  ORF Transcript_21102/g.45996 Transcript_21102/m.45996 type:complete len:211 (+) Transcript_21102:76-708(+)